MNTAPNVHLRLPLPPSTNGLYRNVCGRGRVLTGEAKAWKLFAGSLIMAERMRHGGTLAIPGPVAVHAVMTFPTAAGDLDNRAKALLDALVDGRVIDDDRRVMELHLVRRQDPSGPGSVLLTVSPGLQTVASP